MTEQTQFAVLLFTDICDSTGLKAKHGAMAYKAAAELHNALFERLAAEEQLTLIKNTGDGYFARTTSVAAAVRFALCLQHGLREMQWPSFPLVTRVGIHAGEVADITTLGQTDVLAPAADLVARVMSLAVGGQILLTRSPFDEARHFIRAHPAVKNGESRALAWLAHGPYLFKGCEEPVEVFEVGLTGQAPLIAPPDGEKAKRAIRPGDEQTLGWRPADGQEIPSRPGWLLAEKLGAGSFGEVWAGEQAKTRERRAFKFCFDAERLRALKREVTLTRLLRETLGERDDIVHIHDLRLDEPPYFLESELSTDGNLLQWAERQGGLAKIPLADRIELVAATATALAAAHSVGVLHKDIKPTNVLIFTGKDGRARPRLVDFGIGTLADASVLAQHGITGAGFTGATIQHSSGTPTYSPPEYLAGKPFTVQGDVFSLGVMLWQLVTGKADAPLAEGWQRDVPDELLREDIAACVDGDPARRLPSPADLATRLRALAERRAESTRQREAAAAEQARRKRQRTLIFATAASVLIASIAIPLMLWALRERHHAENATKSAIENEALAKLETERAKAQVREASRSDTATAQARLAEGKWQEGVAYLGRAIRYDPGNRNAQDGFWLAVRYGKPDAGRYPVHSLVHESSVRIAAFSADGCRVVTASSDSARIWDTQTGAMIGSPLKHEGTVTIASFSPDGTRLLTASMDGSKNTAHIWDVERGQAVGAALIHEDTISSAKFSPDGTRVITASQDKSARVWDANDGQPIGIPLHHEKGVDDANFSPDGTRVITASHDRTARMWDAQSGHPIGAPMKHTDWVIIANFSPDGSRVVTASMDSTARIWDAEGGQPVGSPLKHGFAVRDATFSPDGTRVITASQDKTARIWDAKDGQPVGVPLKHEDSVNTARFSRNGTRVITASSDKTARIWDAKSGQLIGAPFWQESAVMSAIFSADDTRALTVSSDRAVRIWDAVGSARPIGTPLAREERAWSASSSPDGSRVLTVSQDRSVRISNAQTGQPIGVTLGHESAVWSAGFSLDGTRVVTESDGATSRVWEPQQIALLIGPPADYYGAVWRMNFPSRDGTRAVSPSRNVTARIWDAKPSLPIGALVAENLAAFVAGARLDPQLGTLRAVSSEDRLALWRNLQPALAGLSDWHFAGEQAFPRDPRTALVSRGATTTIRQAATSLMRAATTFSIHEALALDPTHPLIPFAFAGIEMRKSDAELPNSARAVWLIADGSKRLPDDTSADDLRLAARYVAFVARTIPETKATALALLDRAAKLTSENDETKALRAELVK